ncbi:MAG TPA: DNA primase, partial [Bryobacteraceae bacterium]|nr:DNA primase [Bryobacteraceae bacterium]
MEFVEQLKSSIDIVKVAGEYVRLKRLGATGRYVGLCPFHQEKTPSFNVNQTRQFYKCFGCGVGGDAIKFVEEIEGLSFWETVKMLAERYGIPMPKRSDYSDADSKLRGALLEMHTIAARLFQDSLRGPQGAEARAYLSKRGVSQEVIDTFELGYAEPSGQALTRKLSERSFSAEQLEASGLVRKRNESQGYYDSFRGRLMFPIHNESGKVIAFGGRSMNDEDQPKYLNSPETPVYKKTSILYNLHRARDAVRRSGRAVLVEGYMDVIGVYAAGVKEVVASCGTALTNGQVRTMHRHADTVVVNFDPDTAGANATEKAIQLLLDEGLHVRVVALDGGLDPDEYCKQNGAEAYRAKLDGATTYFHWLADRARSRFDMKTSDGKVAAFKFLLPAVQKIRDKLEQAATVNDLASYLGVDPGLVLDQFKKSAADRRAPVPQAEPASAIPHMERILLNALLASDRARTEMLPALLPEMTAAFVTREVFEGLRQAAEDGPAFSYAALEGRLQASGRELLRDAVTAD